MDINETNLDIDFSSNSSTGEIMSLDSFLDIAPPEDVVPEETPSLEEEVVTDIKKEEPKVVDETIIIDLDDEQVSDTGDFNYKSVVEKMISENLWEEIDTFETDEGDVPFSEMDISEETFMEIYQHNIEKKEEAIRSESVSTKNISDFTKQLVEIDRNGGDIQKALQAFNQVKNPLDNIDFNSESGQQTAIAMKLQAKGVADSDILSLLKSYKASNVLEEKALLAKTEIEGAYQAHLDGISNEAKLNKEKEATRVKLFRKDLGLEIDTTFDINDNYKRKVVDFVSKADEKGLTKVRNTIEEVLVDPKRTAELALFLMDKEEYLKQATSKEDEEKTRSTFKKMRFATKSRVNKVTPDKKEDNKRSSKDYIDLQELLDN